MQKFLNSTDIATGIRAYTLAANLYGQFHNKYNVCKIYF